MPFLHNWQRGLNFAEKSNVADLFLMFRFLMFLVFLGYGSRAAGQRRVWVFDMDTRKPVPGVAIRADHRKAVTTRLDGTALIEEPFDSISFSHVQYGFERLARAELTDTMFLLPNDHMLPEVTVTELDPRVKGLITAWAKTGAMMGAAEAPAGLVSFDFANMLDRRGRRDRKHKKQAEVILKEWDKKKVDDANDGK